jgi:hypothetical protein
LAAKAAATPDHTIASPAKIGPMKRARLKMIELIATAGPRSARGTSDGTSASRAGWLNATTMPWMAVSRTINATLMWPLAVAANSTTACASRTNWLVFTRLSRSRRSATAPANGAITITGKKSANATTPSQKPDSVSFQVSQPIAIRSIHMPVSENALPSE